MRLLLKRLFMVVLGILLLSMSRGLYHTAFILHPIQIPIFVVAVIGWAYGVFGLVLCFIDTFKR